MKKILILKFVLLSFSLSIFAQTNFQAALKPTIGVPSGVSVFLKSTASFSGKVSSLLVCIAIPTSIGIKPTVTVNNSPNTSVVYDIIPQLNQDIQGVSHYIYALGGTGDVGATGLVFSGSANVEKEIVRFAFAGAGNAPIKMVNLPDGGLGDGSAGGNAQGFFGFSIDGLDRVNDNAMFYTVAGASTAQNNLIPGGISGLSYSITDAAIVLPTKFTAFSATKRDNDGLLNFVVENETDITEKYEVERSLDGTTFEKINTLAAVKNGAASNVYNVVDANLANTKNNGIIYYRIKQIDADGKTAYTEIKSIRLVDKAGLSAFPNPVQDYTNVRIDVLENTEITLTLVNAEGKQIMTKTLQVQKGTNLTKLDMSPLAAGNYLIKAMVGAELKTISVIKL